MEDSLWAGLTDSHAGLPMGMTAENLGDKVRLSDTTVNAGASVLGDATHYSSCMFASLV